MMSQAPVVVAYGGGLNSTAMLIGLVERGEPVDLILFADTGGERPDTYAFIDLFEEWLVAQGYPGIIDVQTTNRNGDNIALEEVCLDQNQLPSLAYGWKSCSDKHKRRPQDKYVNNWIPAKRAWKRGQKVVKLIGYDADEDRRVNRAKDKVDPKYEIRYPLFYWGWDRDRCKEAVESVGLPVPEKSSCFFCPAMKKPEIAQLAHKYPELYQRALAMEDNAQENLKSVKGLGRRYSWREVDVNTYQLPMVNGGNDDACDVDNDDVPCGCFDG